VNFAADDMVIWMMELWVNASFKRTTLFYSSGFVSLVCLLQNCAGNTSFEVMISR
jgi:hypothetical protein